MSFTEASRQISRRAATEALALAATRKDALGILSEAESRGDAELAHGIRTVIAERWPLRKPIDYTSVLEVTNKVIQRVVTAASNDSHARQTSHDFTAGKITFDVFTRTYQPIVATYVDGLAKILDTAQADVDKADQLLADQVNKLLEKPGGSIEEQLLFETQAQRAWNRLKPQLDNLGDRELIVSIDRIVGEAVGPGARAAVIEELPAYLSARGLARGMDRDASGRVVRDTMVQDALVQADPMAIAADRARSRANEYFLVVRHNITHMRELLTTDHAAFFSQSLDQLFNGRNPRFITAEQANLEKLSSEEVTAANRTALINV